MSVLRVGMIGAGMIAQVEHIPNLLKLKDVFEIVGVSDPSESGRRFIADTFGVRAVPAAEDLLAKKLDAVVIACPDALHLDYTLAALAAGLHVFCEKPLTYAPADIDRIIAARNKAGKVVQVGYMKRFDPHYEAALRLMPSTREKLRYVAVEVNDPDAWPFVRHHATFAAQDVASDL
ncbi:MAG: Gfo/Idh/MocA family protein, partial [Parvibaculaceae bacterium]